MSREVRPQIVFEIHVPALQGDYIERASKEMRLRRDVLVEHIWNGGFADFCAGRKGEAPAALVAPPQAAVGPDAATREVGPPPQATDAEHTHTSLRAEIERLKMALSNSQASAANARNDANEHARRIEQMRVESIRVVGDLKRRLEEATSAKNRAEQDAALARNAFEMQKTDVARLAEEIAGARAELDQAAGVIADRNSELAELEARPPEKIEPAPGRVEIELIALKTEVARLGAAIMARPASRMASGPLAESDILSLAMVKQARHMQLRGVKIEAIAEWAGVSTEAMKIVLGGKRAGA